MIVIIAGVALWAATAVATLVALGAGYVLAWRRRRREIIKGHAQVAEMLAGAWEAREDREGL